MGRELGDQGIGSVWNAWVGHWIGVDLAPGEQRAGDLRLLPEQILSMHISRDENTHAGSTLTLEIAVAMDQETMREWVEQLAQIVSGEKLPPDFKFVVTDGTVIERIEAVLDLNSLRPVEVTRQIDITCVLNGEPKATSTTYKYSFAW